MHARLMTSNLSFRALVYALDACVQDSLQMHVCMSGTYTPNLVCMHFGVHVNCKPKIPVSVINSMNMLNVLE